MQNSDLEVLETAIEWLNAGRVVELVTLVKTWGSAPRPIGSLAAVRDDGMVIGSVSGGCVEKELGMLMQQQNNNIVEYQVSHDQAMRFGLTCGGSLDLVFEKLTDPGALQEIVANLKQRKRISRTLVLSTGETSTQIAGRYDEFSSTDETVTKVFGPSWRLLLIGAGQLSRFTAEFAIALDYEVIVCEPRTHFKDAWHIPGVLLTTMSPDEAVHKFASDAQSGVLALTHDPNLDDLAVLEALDSAAFYVGSLGSRRNNELRRRRLCDLGSDEGKVSKLYGPVGLPIGSRTPAEIGISIMAEITAVRSEKNPGPGRGE